MIISGVVMPTQSIIDTAERQEQSRANNVDEAERNDPTDVLTHCRYVDKSFIEKLLE